MEFNNIKKEEYCVHTNFPKVEKNVKEEKVLRKLIDIYSGIKGELTSVSQYIYQSFFLKSKYEKISDILENISICEMKHLEIISQVLLSMDINPKFCKYIDNNQNICVYWSASNIKYMTDIEKIIDYDITLEEYAIKDYNDLLNLTNSQNIKDIVNEILKDEKTHLSVLKKIKEELIKDSKSRCCDTESTNDIENKNMKSSNTKNEIVSIFSSSPIINLEEKTEVDLSRIKLENNNNNSFNEIIQIPVSDLNNITDDDIKYKNELENKIYSPDEIIDG